MKGIAFKDRVVAHVFAGNGGDGCASFRREKYVDRGGPDGGDGGRGGSILVRADKDVDSLASLFFQPIQRAGHGGRGKGKQRTGEDGDDLVIPVPCGTQVWEIPPGGAATPESIRDYSPDTPIELDDKDGEPRDNVFNLPREFIGEVVRDGETLVVAQGGRGGRGNQHFATPSHQAPREFTHGTKGEIKRLILEVKTVADIGLVGYPNAGKSTLLSKLSHARPKIAAYPFTTLNPIIGTLVFDDYTSIRIADIPGLIQGAHAGVGLGHDFLRHIERSGFLVFVIDISGQEGRNPADDFNNLRKEIRLYREDLAFRPYLVVANKMDVPGAGDHLAAFRKATGEQPLPISAETGEGIPDLKQMLYEWRRGLRTFAREAGP